MRSNEERIALMHQRAMQMKKEEHDRTVRIMQGTGVSLALVAVILLAFFMPRFTGHSVQGSIPAGMNASIFSQKEALGFIVIAVLSFLAGTAATIFCFYLKKWHGES